MHQTLKDKFLFIHYYLLRVFSGFPRVKFGVRMDVIIHINLPLDSVYLSIKNRIKIRIVVFKI